MLLFPATDCIYTCVLADVASIHLWMHDTSPWQPPWCWVSRNSEWNRRYFLWITCHLHVLWVVCVLLYWKFIMEAMEICKGLFSLATKLLLLRKL